jgi:hypothetical protein
MSVTAVADDVDADGIPVTDEAEPRTAWWANRLGWGIILGLGWITYEVTQRPVWGLAVVCLKFGWGDLRTGLWLLWRDPSHARGVICSLFYFASAASKVTLASFVGAAVILWLAAALRERPPKELLGLRNTALLGLGILVVVSLAGAIAARLAGVRVWLDSSVGKSRDLDEWPPSRHGHNRTLGVAVPAIIVASLAAPQVVSRLGFMPVLGLILVTSTLLWWLFQSIAALAPDECWPELRHGSLARCLAGEQDADDEERLTV